MEEQKQAVETAKAIASHREMWSLVIGFVFGTFTGIIFTLRSTKKLPPTRQWVSSAILSGLLSICFIGLLIWARTELHIGVIIFIGIMCGLSTDSLVRLVAEAGTLWGRKVFGAIFGIKFKDDECNDSETDQDH